MASSREIEHIAAAWLARRDAGPWSDRDQAQLDAWLEASTAHRVAFIRLDAGWRQADRLKALGAGLPAGTVPERGTWARHHFPEPLETPSWPAASATPIGAATPVRARRTRIGSGQRVLRYAMAGSLAMVLALALLLGWRHYMAVDTSSYRTGVGRLQDIALIDGSAVTLSSDSRMLASFSRSKRRIDLQQGEAFFQVAKDPGRPFVVRAGNRRVVAVGTRFAVRSEGADLRVIVTEGLVRLEADNGPDGRRQPSTLLPAGSVALASADGITVHSGSVQQAEEYLSWRSGFVTFHDTSLTLAAAEFNRYNARKIVIGDAATGALRVGGNFRWSNVDTFVRLLEQGFPIEARRRGDTIVLRSR